MIKTLTLVAALLVTVAHAREPYDSIAKMYYALPQVHTRMEKEMMDEIRKIDPNVDKPVTAAPKLDDGHKTRSHIKKQMFRSCGGGHAGCTTLIRNHYK